MKRVMLKFSVELEVIVGGVAGPSSASEEWFTSVIKEELEAVVMAHGDEVEVSLLERVEKSA